MFWIDSCIIGFCLFLVDWSSSDSFVPGTLSVCNFSTSGLNLEHQFLGGKSASSEVLREKLSSYDWIKSLVILCCLDSSFSLCISVSRVWELIAVSSSTILSSLTSLSLSGVSKSTKFSSPTVVAMLFGFAFFFFSFIYFIAKIRKTTITTVLNFQKTLLRARSLFRLQNRKTVYSLYHTVVFTIGQIPKHMKKSWAIFHLILLVRVYLIIQKLSTMILRKII